MLEDDVNRFLNKDNPDAADALNMLQTIRGSGLFQKKPRYFGEEYVDIENSISISRYKWFCGQRVSVKKRVYDPESSHLHFSIYTIIQRKHRVKIIDNSYDIPILQLNKDARLNDLYDDSEKYNFK